MSIRQNSLSRAAFPTCVLAIALAAAAGCGGGDTFGHVPVQGEVKFDGQPMAKGKIIFVPTQEGQQQAVGDITAGAYRLAGSDAPSLGKYKVMIYVDHDLQVAMDDPEAFAKSDFAKGKRPPLNPVADEFNLATTLTAEVKASGENEFDFQVTSRPKNVSATLPKDFP